MGKRKKRQLPGQGLYEWIQAAVPPLLAVLLVSIFAVRAIAVSGGSMRETLQDGDRLVVLSGWLCGGYDPGDIVVLCKPGFHDGAPIVKRVIAGAGQTVDIDFETGMVLRDGEVLQEDYIREPTYRDEGLEFPLTVPEGCVFVMGDNRNSSDDSRNPALGPVDVRSILGRAVFLAVPGAAEDTGERDWSRIRMLNQED